MIRSGAACEQSPYKETSVFDESTTCEYQVQLPSVAQACFGGTQRLWVCGFSARVRSFGVSKRQPAASWQGVVQAWKKEGLVFMPYSLQTRHRDRLKLTQCIEGLHYSREDTNAATSCLNSEDHAGSPLDFPQHTRSIYPSIYLPVYTYNINVNK